MVSEKAFSDIPKVVPPPIVEAKIVATSNSLLPLTPLVILEKDLKLLPVVLLTIPIMSKRER
jgi:hypothetical protein